MVMVSSARPSPSSAAAATRLRAADLGLKYGGGCGPPTCLFRGRIPKRSRSGPADRRRRPGRRWVVEPDRPCLN
jgi:hypothetical protein